MSASVTIHKVISEAAQTGVNSRHSSVDEYRGVWKAFTCHMYELLSTERGVRVPFFGHVSLFRDRTIDHKNPPLVPYFFFSAFFVQQFKVKSRNLSILKRPDAPEHDVSFGRISVFAGVDKVKAKGLLKDIILTMGKRLKDCSTCDLDLGVGRMRSAGGTVDVEFYPDFVSTDPASRMDTHLQMLLVPKKVLYQRKAPRTKKEAATFRSHYSTDGVGAGLSGGKAPSLWSEINSFLNETDEDGNRESEPVTSIVRSRPKSAAARPSVCKGWDVPDDLGISMKITDENRKPPMASDEYVDTSVEAAKKTAEETKKFRQKLKVEKQKLRRKLSRGSDICPKITDKDQLAHYTQMVKKQEARKSRELSGQKPAKPSSPRRPLTTRSAEMRRASRRQGVANAEEAARYKAELDKLQQEAELIISPRKIGANIASKGQIDVQYGPAYPKKKTVIGPGMGPSDPAQLVREGARAGRAYNFETLVARTDPMKIGWMHGRSGRKMTKKVDEEWLQSQYNGIKNSFYRPAEFTSSETHNDRASSADLRNSIIGSFTPHMNTSLLQTTNSVHYARPGSAPAQRRTRHQPTPESVTVKITQNDSFVTAV